MEDLANSFGGILLVLIAIALIIFLCWFFIFKVKHLKTPEVYMVDGGVKTGKSLVTVMLAVKQYRKNVIKFHIANWFIKLFNKTFWRKNKRNLKERPMLYSNMPLYKVKYNKLTLDIMLWKVRIPHKSVVIIDEATLLADSMSGMVIRGKKLSEEQQRKFDDINETLTLFLKTFGHQTHGGSCFYNSQQVIDLHFAFKRCTSTYLFIAKNRKYPFFCLVECRELIHDESGDITNVNRSDVDDDNRPLFVSKRWYKYYDRFYLDVLTKHLNLMVDYEVKPVQWRDKKELKEIITLGTYKRIQEYNENQQKAQNKKEVKQDEKK